MALQTFRTDDLTGDADATTVRIVVNGKGVELDLAAKSMTRLVKALEPFWTVGTEGDYDVTPRPAGRRGIGRELTKGERVTIREWAVAQGLISAQARGRLPGAVVEQYFAR